MADKKKVSKASIGLPLSQTLKLFTYNCNPFILEFCIPVEDFRKRSLGQLTDTRANPWLNTVPNKHISLGGTTLYSSLSQKTFAAPPNLVVGLPRDIGVGQTSDDIARPIPLNLYENNRRVRLAEKVCGWLDQVTSPVAIEPEFSDFVHNLVVDEEVWILIEQSARQRKSPLRQIPIMSTGTNDASIRGSNSTRPSGSYSRPGESITRSTMNPIRDHPGTVARKPKSMPSGSQLPSCWNDEMDEFICHMEAQCEFSIKAIVRALKQRFAELREVSIPLSSFQPW